MGKIHRYVRERRRTVVIAVDKPSFDLAQLSDLLKEVSEEIAALKIGLTYLLHYTPRRVSNVVSRFHDLYLIADLKLADVGDIMSLAAKEVLEYGFDGVVAHAIVSISGALDKLSKTVNEYNADLILQTSMTHPGSVYTFDRLYPELKNIINGIKPEALIAPANKPELIRDLRESFGWRHVILAPGVVSGGAVPGEGICWGADAEVVGRAVLNAPNPVEALEDIIRRQKEFLRNQSAACVERP